MCRASRDPSTAQICKHTEKGIQTPMAQGRSTAIISRIKRQPRTQHCADLRGGGRHTDCAVPVVGKQICEVAGVEGGCWRRKGWGGERDNKLRALRATRPHTLSYLGRCDEEQGVIKSESDNSPCLHLTPATSQVYMHTTSPQRMGGWQIIVLHFFIYTTN